MRKRRFAGSALPIQPESKDGTPAERCELCPLHKEGNKTNCVGARVSMEHRVLVDSDLPIKYLLVGEALGKVENKKALPFVGPTGKLLDKTLDILTSHGLDRGEVAYTNAIRCMPPLMDDGSLKSPLVGWKRACRRYLEAEVHQIKPEAIIALGGHAWSTLMNTTEAVVGRNRLRVKPFVWSDEDGGLPEIPCMVTYHPAYVLRDMTRSRELLEDLHAYMVEDLWKGREEQVVDVMLIEEADDLLWVLDRVATADVIGLDIETVQFEPRVLTIGLCFPGDSKTEAFVIPIYHPESNHPHPKLILEWFRKHVLERDCLVVGQNIKYDLGRLARATGGNCAFKCKADDAMLYHYMLDENARVRNLDHFARRYTSLRDYKDDIDGGDLKNTPIDIVAKYNGKDAIAPILVIDKLSKELEHYGYFSPHLVEFNRRLAPYVAALESNGMCIDLKRLDTCDRSYRAKIGLAKKKLYEHCPDDLNLNSPKQLADFIFGDLGLAPLDVRGSKTPTGQMSTKEEILSQMEPHPFLETLLAYRSAMKVRGSYITNLKENVQIDGVAYPNYFYTKIEFGSADMGATGGGTTSSRLSAKNPAVQTIPAGEMVRSAYVSRYPGGSLFGLDASQMELRYGAWWSGDQTLRVACSGDPHQATADLCGVSRPIGKRINFACLYGSTIKGLMVNAGLDKGTSTRINNMIRKAWKSLYAKLDEIEGLALNAGEACTPYGRWRRTPQANSRSAVGRHLILALKNFMIQSPASDLSQLLGWRLMRALDGVALVITSTHDSVLLDVPRGHNKLVTSIIQDVVTSQWKDDALEVLGLNLDFPFEFELKVGPNWLDQKVSRVFSC